MKKLLTGILAAVLLIIVISSALKAQTPKPPPEWSHEKASPFYCALHQCGTRDLQRYDVQLLVRISNPKPTDIGISILKDGNVAYSFDGHIETVFAIKAGILYRAQYSPDRPGAAIIAIDLATKKELRKKELEGLPPRTHSMYGNSLNLDLLEVAEAHGLAIRIVGHETFGDYVEILEAATGKQIRHEITHDAFKK